MTTTNADTFKAALQQIEREKDPTALVDLFGDGSTIDSPSRDGKLTGRQSIHNFWAEYLSAFESVRSTFTVDQTIGDTSILQWVSEGKLTNGKPIRYRGVSIVTFKGYKVSTFTTYFDSAAFIVSPADKPAAAAFHVNNEGGD